MSDAAELHQAFELGLSFAGGIAAHTAPTIQDAFATPDDVIAILIDQDTWGLPGAAGSAQALRARFPNATIVFIGDDLSPVISDAEARKAGGDIRVGLPAPIADLFARLEATGGYVLPRVPMSLVLPVREALDDDASGEKTLADARVTLSRAHPDLADSAPAIMSPPTGAPAIAPPADGSADPSDGAPSLLARVKRLKQTLDATKRHPALSSESLMPPEGATDIAPPPPAFSRSKAPGSLPDISGFDMDRAVDEALDQTLEGEGVSDALAGVLATEGESDALGSTPLSLEAPSAARLSTTDPIEAAVLEADKGRTGEGAVVVSEHAPHVAVDPWGDLTTRSYEEHGVDASLFENLPNTPVPHPDAVLDVPSLPESLDGTPVDGASRLLRTDDPVDDEEGAPPAPPALADAFDDVAMPDALRSEGLSGFDEALFSDEGAPVSTEAPPPPPALDAPASPEEGDAPDSDSDRPLFSDEGLPEPGMPTHAGSDAVPVLSAGASFDEELPLSSREDASTADNDAILARLAAFEEARAAERAALEQRIASKNDEILSLQSLHEAARAHVDTLTSEHARVDSRAEKAEADARRLDEELHGLRATLEADRARGDTEAKERAEAQQALERALDDARARNDALKTALQNAVDKSEGLSLRLEALERERDAVEHRAKENLDETAARLHDEVARARDAATRAREEHESAQARLRDELREEMRAQKEAFAERTRADDEAARAREAEAVRQERAAAEIDTLRLLDELTREHEEHVARALRDALAASAAERAIEIAHAADEARAEQKRAVDEAVARALAARADDERAHLAHTLETSRADHESDLARALAALRSENAAALTDVERRLEEAHTRAAEERAHVDEERERRITLEQQLLAERHDRALEREKLDDGRQAALASLEARLEDGFATRWRALEKELAETRAQARSEIENAREEKRLLDEEFARARAQHENESALAAERARVEAARVDDERRALRAALEEGKAEYARLVALVEERERERENERVQERSAFAEERERMTAAFEREADERARQAVAAELAAREHEEARLFAKLAFRRGSFDAVYENAREPLAVVGENAWEEAERLHQSADEAPFRADTGAPLDPDVARPTKLLEPLAGAFGDGEIAGLLFSAFHLGTTGRLVVTDTTGHTRALFLENGEPVAFTSTLPRDRPEETLLRKGLITTAKHHELRAADALSARRLCGLLVEEKSMKPEELFAAIRGVLTDQVMSMLEWDMGRFAFDDGRAAPHDRVRLAQSMDALLAEAVRRKLSEERLWRIVGGPQTVLTRDDRAPRMPPLSPLELESATRFDGTRALEDVILDVGGPAEIPLRTAFLLVSCGALRVVARGLPRGDNERERLVEDAIAIDRARIEDRQRLTREGDYFAILGVDENATSTDVERAAQALRKRFAPERFQAPAFRDLARALVEICQVIDEARAVLSDTDLRRTYRDRRRRHDAPARAQQQRA